MAKSSRLGIASALVWLLLVVLNVVLWAVFFYAAVIAEPTGSLRGPEHQDAVLTAFGVVMIAIPLGHLVGVVLGIVSLVRREPRKALAIIGLVLNGLALLGVAAFGLLAWLGRHA